MFRSFLRRSALRGFVALAAIGGFAAINGTRSCGRTIANVSLPRLSYVYARGPAEGNHLAPVENLERLDVAQLRGARRSVDIAMYAFTDKYIAAELVRLADSGIAIRVYRDGEQFASEEERGDSTTAMFAGHRNIHVRIKPPSRRNLQHLKAFVVDGALLRDGSANWSAAGLKEQDNNARYTTDNEDVQRFMTNYEVMWNRPTNRIVQ